MQLTETTNNSVTEIQVAIKETNVEIKKININIQNLWEATNLAMKKAEKNEQTINQIIEDNDNFKKNIKEEIKTTIENKFKDLTNDITQLKEENEDLRNRSMRSTLIFRGIPEDEASDSWEVVSQNIAQCYHSFFKYIFLCYLGYFR